MHELTIAIPARNASATIERAVRSAVRQGDHAILLIDDWSEDHTALLAQRTAGARLTVVRPPCHKTIGFARQTGILHATSPYLVWLDADDELLPGRVDRMLDCFRHRSADIVSDGVELVDGATHTRTKVAPVPSFLNGKHPLTRQFERNYLPGVAMIGVRVAFARAVGYDETLHGTEDSDFVLRSAFRLPHVALLSEPGYRMYTYPTSLSRNIEAQRKMVRRSLLKHTYESVRRLYEQCGYSVPVAQWALVSMATFREEYDQALAFLAAVEAGTTEPDAVLEPDGPSPYQEAWRLAFHRGTLELLRGRPGAAMACLQEAERRRPSAEGANNLGVAFSRCGHHQAARAAFLQAIDRFPAFLDARLNLETEHPWRTTTHPLRVQPNRDDYVAANAERRAAGF